MIAYNPLNMTKSRFAPMNCGEFNISEILFLLFPLHILLPWQTSVVFWWPWKTVGPIEVIAFYSVVLVACLAVESVKLGSILKNNLWWLVFSLFVIVTISHITVVYWDDNHTLKYIGSKLYSGIPLYFVSFISAYLILWKKWGIEKISKLFLVLSGVGVVIICDALFSYFLIIDKGTSIAFNNSGMFWGHFSFNLHIVSKFSLVVFWLNIFLFFRYRKLFFLLLAILTLFVAVIVFNKATFVGLIVGSLLFSFFLFYSKTKNSLSCLALKVLTVVLFVGISMWLYIFVSNSRASIGKGYLYDIPLYKVLYFGNAFNNKLYKAGVDEGNKLYKAGVDEDNKLYKAGVDEDVDEDNISLISSAIYASTDRIFQYARACDVLLEKPLGSGAGLGYLMAFSKKIPPRISSMVRDKDIFIEYSKTNRSGWLGANIIQDYVGLDGKTFSLHNAVLNIVVDYGVFSVVLILFFIVVFRYALLVIKYRNNICPADFLAFASLVSAMLSMSVACASTSKFYPQWFWVILFFSIKVQFESFGCIDMQPNSKK